MLSHISSSPIIYFGIWLIFVPIFGIAVYNRERQFKDVGSVSLICALLICVVSINPVVRYVSWAWFSSSPPVTGLYGWVVTKSDFLWATLLVVLFFIVVLSGRSQGSIDKLSPRDLAILSFSFPVFIAPVLFFVILSTLVS